LCDPVSLSIASTVAGIAGSGINAMGAMNAQKKQKQEVEAWAQRQDRMRAAEKVRQEGMRQQAEAARVAGLEQVGAEGQKKTQSEEETRLASYLQGEDATAAAPAATTPVSAADANLTQTAGGQADPQKTDLAKKINEATTSAKQRIAAMARTSSYTGSSGGLDYAVSNALGRSGAGIDQQNEYRRGSMAAFDREKGVDPVQVSYQESPLAGIFADMTSLGAQGLGNAYGNAKFGKFLGAPTPKKFIGPSKPLPAYLSTTGGLF